MWNAFKSDLIDFVTTIKDDTTKTIHKVIGDNPEHEEETDTDSRIKAITDARRSYSTYSSPIEEMYCKEYDKFSKNFSLSSYATEIAETLDEEVDVARFYAELVPLSLTPEQFWSRYFFKVLLINRNGAVSLDDDDDEELQWETSASENVLSVENSFSLQQENEILRGQVKVLVNRIAELEKLIAAPLESNSKSNCLPAVDVGIAEVALNRSQESMEAGEVTHGFTMVEANETSSKTLGKTEVDVPLKEKQELLSQELLSLEEDDEDGWT